MECPSSRFIWFRDQGLGFRVQVIRGQVTVVTVEGVRDPLQAE